MAILSQSPQQISRQFCFQSQEGQEPSFTLTPPATSTVTMAPKLYPPKSLGRRDFDWPDSRDGTWKKWQVWTKFHTQISSCPTNGEQLSPTFLSLSPTFFSNFFSSCYSVLLRARPDSSKTLHRESTRRMTQQGHATCRGTRSTRLYSCVMLCHVVSLKAFNRLSTYFNCSWQSDTGPLTSNCAVSTQESSTSSSIVQHISTPNLHFKASDPQPPHLDLLQRSECFAEPLGDIRMGRNRKTQIEYWTNWIQLNPIESKWPYIHGIAWHSLHSWTTFIQIAWGWSACERLESL